MRQVARTKQQDPDEFVRDYFQKAAERQAAALGEEAPAAAAFDLDEPPTLSWLWNLFRFLQRGRQVFDGVPQPLSLDLGWWERANGVELRPWELEALSELDVAWYNAWRDGRSRSS